MHAILYDEINLQNFSSLDYSMYIPVHTSIMYMYVRVQTQQISTIHLIVLSLSPWIKFWLGAAFINFINIYLKQILKIMRIIEIFQWHLHQIDMCSTPVWFHYISLDHPVAHELTIHIWHSLPEPFPSCCSQVHQGRLCADWAELSRYCPCGQHTVSHWFPMIFWIEMM